jgi:hypothetical protein
MNTLFDIKPVNSQFLESMVTGKKPHHITFEDTQRAETEGQV